jgi:hypothetical protein
MTQNRIESPELDSYLHGKLLSAKVSKQISEVKVVFQHIVLGQPNICMKQLF